MHNKLNSLSIELFLNKDSYSQTNYREDNTKCSIFVMLKLLFDKCTRVFTNESFAFIYKFVEAQILLNRKRIKCQ